ncbi:MAG: hypothetical protein GX600_04175 [Dehalococcoidia bacterium]|jgi:hypothetical protein|nr:hypothetical protein [Dehalococcoidia bacterium]
MSNRKKLVAGVLVATMALAGVLAGTLSADEESPGAPRDPLFARVAELLGLEQQQVEGAFQQAMSEQRAERQAEMEAARDARLQELIDDGVLTEQQVEEWNAWLESRPDVGDEMREWFESRPDMGDVFPQGPGPQGRMSDRFGGRAPMFGGPMGGGRGFQGDCPAFAPAN